MREDFISKLRKIPYSDMILGDDDQHRECMICFDEFKEGDDVF